METFRIRFLNVKPEECVDYLKKIGLDWISCGIHTCTYKLSYG